MSAPGWTSAFVFCLKCLFLPYIDIIRSRAIVQTYKRVGDGFIFYGRYGIITARNTARIQAAGSCLLPN